MCFVLLGKSQYGWLTVWLGAVERACATSLLPVGSRGPRAPGSRYKQPEAHKVQRLIMGTGHSTRKRSVVALSSDWRSPASLCSRESEYQTINWFHFSVTNCNIESSYQWRDFIKGISLKINGLQLFLCPGNDDDDLMKHHSCRGLLHTDLCCREISIYSLRCVSGSSEIDVFSATEEDFAFLPGGQ